MDNIFNDDYFESSYAQYNDAMEATAMKKALVGVLGGPLGQVIGNIVHNSRVNKSEVTSLVECMKQYGEKEGRRAFNSTVNFFIKNDLLSDQYVHKEVIMFKDLTPKGKEFMRGYYSCIDEIRKFDYATAKTNAKNPNAEGVTTTILTPLNAARHIAQLIRYTNSAAKMTEALASVGVNVAVGGTGIAFSAIMGLIAATFNITDTIVSFKSSNRFKETMSNAKESTNIFDENYFMI